MTRRLTDILGDPLTIVANIMMLVGLLGTLFGLGNWLFALVGLGLFGPYVLRETGLVPWHDDFQREANMRAGMYALVAVGLYLTAIITVEGMGGSGTPDRGYEYKDLTIASPILTILAMTWILSRLFLFWGTPLGTQRFLAGLLGVTASVAIIGTAMAWQTGGMSLKGILEGLAQIGWMALLIFLVRRWPRLVGWLLLATVAAMVPILLQFTAHDMGVPTWTGAVDLVVIVVIPLLIPGIALVTYKNNQEGDPT